MPYLGMNVPLPSGSCPLCACILHKTVPHYRGQKGHKGAPLSTLCLLYITAPRNEKKSTFRDKNVEEMPFSSTKKGACFTLKGHFSLRKKGTFWVLEILGVQAPRHPDSTALDCAPSGAMRKVHGDNFPVPPSLYIRAQM